GLIVGFEGVEGFAEGSAYVMQSAGVGTPLKSFKRGSKKKKFLDVVVQCLPHKSLDLELDLNYALLGQRSNRRFFPNPGISFFCLPIFHPLDDDGGGEALDRIYECLDVTDASNAVGFNKKMQEKKPDFSENAYCFKIHACPNDCMLYWKEDAKKKCGICGHARFKKGRKGRGKHKEVPYKVLRYLPLTPRLQRLFMSSKYAEHMSWHKKGRPKGVLTHPSDGEAWKHLDRSDPSFAEDARNVRLGLSTDGFIPFGHSSIPYSCWPYYGSRWKGVRRGAKHDRVTSNQPTPIQLPHSMSPIADSSIVFEASEEESYLNPLIINMDIDQESSTRKRGPRGANLNKNIPTDSSQRKVIHISGLNYLELEVVRAITKDFKALFYGEVTQWHKLDKDLVEIFYKSFQDGYQYEDNVDPETAGHKKVPGDEEGSYVRHTEGCVSFELHCTRWETELGIQMTDIEFFEKLHKKDKGKGTWCDLRVERAAAKYREIVMKKNGVDDLVDIPFDDEAWAEATCFTKKNNKGYGFGLTKQAERICTKAKRTKRFRAYNSRIDEAWIELEVAARVEKRMEAFEADMQ
nr:hypothetical protein [Tanacetum cinerariifolium]